jgi:hypothetical protein
LGEFGIDRARLQSLFIAFGGGFPGFGLRSFRRANITTVSSTSSRRKFNQRLVVGDLASDKIDACVGGKF